jgi:hypothetical protein
MTMTQQQAETLARWDESYVARQRRGVWFVWCTNSEHVVEFDTTPCPACVESCPEGNCCVNPK